MSRGPGHVERAIAGILDAKPDNAFTTEELCRVAYPAAKHIEKKHRVAVLRSATKLQQRRDALDYLTSEHLGGSRVYFNWASVQSYAMAHLKRSEHYASADSRLENHQIKNEAQLRAILKSKDYRKQYTDPGGAWWRHVQSWLAERDARLAKDDAKLIEVLTERWEFNCRIYRVLGNDLPPQPPELVRLLRRQQNKPRKRQHSTSRKARS
jgi:hypothetical protein